jgi:diacylglycerol kinase (ATP)
MEAPQRPDRLRRLINATDYSLSGVRAAAAETFRQELIPATCWCRSVSLGAPASSAPAGVQLLLVLIVELLNSAVEVTVDRVSLENHNLAKRAKDIGSAAVMLSLANVAVVWLLVLV